MSVIESRPESMWTLRWCLDQVLEIPRVAWAVARSQWAPQNLRVAYIGWIGHENLGDQAILNAIRRELAPAHLRHFAGVRKERLLARLLTPRRLYNFGILGGGTLILGGYLQSIETMLQAGISMRCFGTGVEVLEPPLRDDRQYVDRWVAALRRMGPLYVRGPKSKQTLADIGLGDVIVSGDAAILHALPVIAYPPPTKVLGVCITLPSTFTREKNNALFQNVVTACRQAQSEHWKIRIFAVSRGDKKCSNELAQRLGLRRADVRNMFENGDQFVNEVKQCSVFLGVRLHSVILAHCAYVPAIMIAYAPKCIDHMAAVDMENYALRPMEWEPSMIFSKVRQAYDDRKRIRADLFEKCLVYRNQLVQVAENLRREIRDLCNT